MPEPIVLSWSGGKDCALALDALLSDASVRVVGLLTSVTREYDRISVHGVRRELLDAQADALGLPVREVVLPARCSNDVYETAFLSALERVRADCPDVRRVAFGDLFLEDVRAYRERLLARLGMGACFPLWMRSTAELAASVVRRGYRAHLVCVDTRQLDACFAGRLFDADLLAELPPHVDPCGERGEFHTFVSGGPGFAHAIPITLGPSVLRDERFVYCDLVPLT